MKSAYRFIAGNSRITPFGIALAVAVAVALRHALGWWAAPCYLAVLLGTLIVATLEPVQ